jgi:hypothetical protein
MKMILHAIKKRLTAYEKRFSMMAKKRKPIFFDATFLARAGRALAEVSLWRPTCVFSAHSLAR